MVYPNKVPTFWIGGPDSGKIDLSLQKFISVENGVYGRIEVGSQIFSYFAFKRNEVVFMDGTNKGICIGAIMMWFQHGKIRPTNNKKMLDCCKLWKHHLETKSSPEIAHFYCMEYQFIGAAECLTF